MYPTAFSERWILTELWCPDIVNNAGFVRLHYREVSDNLSTTFTTVETDVTSVQLEGKSGALAG